MAKINSDNRNVTEAPFLGAGVRNSGEEAKAASDESCRLQSDDFPSVIPYELCSECVSSPESKYGQILICGRMATPSNVHLGWKQMHDD